MSDEIEVLVELLTDVLGKPHHHYGSKGQISFDCPVCSDEKGLDHGDGKGKRACCSNYVVFYHHIAWLEGSTV